MKTYVYGYILWLQCTTEINGFVVECNMGKADAKKYSELARNIFGFGIFIGYVVNGYMWTVYTYLLVVTSVDAHFFHVLCDLILSTSLPYVQVFDISNYCWVHVYRVPKIVT